VERVTGKRTPSEVLAASRRKDSREKRAKVLAVVDEMTARGETVTFAGVAKTAGVSNWLVYAEGVREHIEAARKKQEGQPRRTARAGQMASAASLQTDLELSRQQVTALRTERDQLKAALQRQLGQQLDQVGTADLVARVDELARQNDELMGETTRLRREKTELEDSLREAEEDLAAARSSLRRMIRDENAGQSPA
jgi:chromosome segregation ATPase